MLIEVITLADGVIVNESVDESRVLHEIEQDHPAAFSMYLELSSAPSQNTAKIQAH